MALRLRIPLAWKNLTHDVRRLLLAAGGVGFAVLLMCMQLAFQDALFDSTLAMIRKLDADLIIVSKAKYTVIVRETFSRRRLYQALQVPGVQSAAPLYVETLLSLVKDLRSGSTHPIRVLAFDPRHSVMTPGVISAQALRALERPGTVLFDNKSKDEYGRLAPGVQVELAGQTVELVGQFSLGTDFANDGNLVTSTETYKQLFLGGAASGLGSVDLGLLKIREGESPEEVRDQVQRVLSHDVVVRTRREFEDQELAFWKRSTPIGYIFQAGVTMGFLVGVIICYQILYADIADHMAEFATLKAMGYPNRYFIGIVLQESVFLSLMGFVPGVLASRLLCVLVAWKTGLLVGLSLNLLFWVLILTLAMCVVSGTLTMRKVVGTDPAELF